MAHHPTREMLRRKPTAITLTSEDVAAFEDSRARASADPEAMAHKEKQATVIDPNDELKPLPGEKARVVRTRDERIGVSSSRA
ncbi:MAG: hypothetical protein M1838_005965 [Thelocarpon superellum]|nr:MAG: hypothetical protein M1838_005965 [Thelocarpon superellum]